MCYVGGGRGGGRGGRGGRGGGGNRDGGEGSGFGEGGGDEKPREIYIPPEPTQDENEMFQSGIVAGNNYQLLSDMEVKVSGENIPQSAKRFSETGLRPILLENVERCGYKMMTAVQKWAIPIVMAKRDLMACSQTGSGKTVSSFKNEWIQ